MKILYKGIEYTVYWKYERCPFCFHNGINKNFKHVCVDATSCFIENLEKGIQVVRLTMRIPPDIYNKEFGRKLSFKRTLEALVLNDKEGRKFFGHWYFEFTNQRDKVDDITLVARMNNRFAEIF